MSFCEELQSAIYDQSIRKQAQKSPITKLVTVFDCLWFRAEIEEAMASPDNSPLRKGRGQSTVIHDKFAQKLRITTQMVRRKKERGRNYQYLMQRSGPGDLLGLGDNAYFLWERHLGKDDVDRLIRFRQKFYPSAAVSSRQLDIVGARAMIKVLDAHGWPYDKLANCRSDLMTHVFRYVSREQLASVCLRVGDKDKVTNMSLLRDQPDSGSVGTNTTDTGNQVVGQQSLSVSALHLPLAPVSEQVNGTSVSLEP
ncbi:MAG: hypothetical protein Q9167_003956 [Letrouitia subvulpina]